MQFKRTLVLVYAADFQMAVEFINQNLGRYTLVSQGPHPLDPNANHWIGRDAIAVEKGGSGLGLITGDPYRIASIPGVTILGSGSDPFNAAWSTPGTRAQYESVWPLGREEVPDQFGEFA